MGLVHIFGALVDLTVEYLQRTLPHLIFLPRLLRFVIAGGLDGIEQILEHVARWTHLLPSAQAQIRELACQAATNESTENGVLNGTENVPTGRAVRGPRGERQVAIVTGASRGIGFEVAKGLLLARYEVILPMRNVEKGKEVAEHLKSITNNNAIHIMEMDTSSMNSVRAFVDAFFAMDKPLHLLVNDAGTWNLPFMKDEKLGVEKQFTTNYLGHFYLTTLLLGVLKKSAPARIVNVASSVHYAVNEIDVRNLTDERKYNGLTNYAITKLAMVLFTYALARRLQGSNVSVFAAHPGVVQTDIHQLEQVIFAKVARSWIARLTHRRPEEGALSIIYAALSPDLNNVTGKYIWSCGIHKSSYVTYEIKKQEALWKQSEELIAKAFTAGELEE